MVVSTITLKTAIIVSYTHQIISGYFETLLSDPTKNLETNSSLGANEHLRFQGILSAVIRSVNTDLQQVKAGWLAQFLHLYKKPPLVHPGAPKSFFNVQESVEMTVIIDQMKDQGALDKSTMAPSFQSSIFLVPKTTALFGRFSI